MKRVSFFMKNRARASASLEYVIVSTFAALLSITAITYVGRIVKTKIDSLSQKVGVEPTEFDFDFDLGQGN